MAARLDLGNCAICFPIRSGMMLICIWRFVLGGLCAMCLFQGDIRLSPGGYNPHTRLVMYVMGALGVIFGFIGWTGVIDLKISWVNTFHYYQCVSALTQFVVFVCDLTTLNECKHWLSDLKSQGAETYNPALTSISTKGLCDIARLSYIVGFSIDFGFALYCSHVSHVFSRRLASAPLNILAFEEGREHDHAVIKVARLDHHHGNPGVHLPKVFKPQESHGANHGAHDQGAYGSL